MSILLLNGGVECEWNECCSSLISIEKGWLFPSMNPANSFGKVDVYWGMGVCLNEYGIFEQGSDNTHLWNFTHLT